MPRSSAGVVPAVIRYWLDHVPGASRAQLGDFLLTAAAASLGLVPIAREVFWGPMAYAMIGGILAATFLTLFFLPALYVGWYRIKAPPKGTPRKVHGADGQVHGAEAPAG